MTHTYLCAACQHKADVLAQLTREAIAGPHGFHECADPSACRQHRTT